MKKRVALLALIPILLSVLILAACRTSPLVNAILKDDGQTVRTLLAGGADVNEQSPDNFSPLHWAVYYNKPEMVRLLLENGANVNLRSGGYGTPLTMAAQFGYTDMVRMLLAKGADVQGTDYAGKTALTLAEEGKFTETAALLRQTDRPRAAAQVAPAPRAAGRVAPDPLPATPVPPSRVDGEPPKRRAPTDGTAMPARLSVFNFEAANIDASRYGPDVTNQLVDVLKANPAFSILNRRELEEFLSINDLQQNDNLENLLNIGTRLGLNFIITGRIEKRGAALLIDCHVIHVESRRAIFSRQARAVGDASLTQEIRKLGGAAADAILNSGF